VLVVFHILGTLKAQFFAGLAEDPSLGSKINFFAGLGPVMTVGNMGVTLLRVISDLGITRMIELFGNQFLPEPVKLHRVFIDFCFLCNACCTDVIEAFCGKHQGSFNNTRMPVMSAHEPSGSSTLNMLHWSQGVKSGKFQKYDYGKAGNLVHYNSLYPPEYNMSNFPKSVPIALYTGEKDMLANMKDTNALVGTLVNVGANLVEWISLPDYAHLDFVWDFSAYHDFYSRLLGLIWKYNN